MRTSWRYIIVPSKSSGKTIVKLKVNKKNVVITFSDKSKLSLVPEVMASFYLYEGKTLDNKAIKELVSFNASASLLKYAISLLKKKHYSEWKMREKLYAKEDANKPAVDQVIKVLKSNDLINDKMLILDTIEYGDERNIGKNKIIAELANKGIFQENLSSISFSYTSEKKKALNNLTKLEKKYSKYSYEQKKQHIYRSLLSLGFDNDVVLEALNHLSKPNDKDELDKLKKDFDKTYLRYKNKYEGYELKNKVVTFLRSKGYKTKDILSRWEKYYGEND